MNLEKYKVVFLGELAQKLAGIADEFIIFVQDEQGNELYTVEDVVEASFKQVLIVDDLDEYEVGGRKHVEITVVDLEWEGRS